MQRLSNSPRLSIYLFSYVLSGAALALIAYAIIALFYAVYYRVIFYMRPSDVLMLSISVAILFVGVILLFYSGKLRIRHTKKAYVRVLSFIWVIPGFFLGVGGLLLLGGPGGPIPGLIMLAIAIAPIVTFMRQHSAIAENGRPAFERSATSIGAKYRHWEVGTGIAVSPEKSSILLAKGNEQATYRFDDVREFKWANVKPEVFFGGGTSAALVGAMNMYEAQDSSGVTLRVKDIEQPEWFVQMKQKSDCKKWFEILTQYLVD